MAVSPQQLTIYLYSAHRAVIFAIAQLSCYTYIENRTIRCPVVAKNDIFNMASVRHLEFKNLYFVQVILS